MNVGGVKRTGSSGTFRTVVNLGKGTKVRLRAPAVDATEPAPRHRLTRSFPGS